MQESNESEAIYLTFFIFIKELSIFRQLLLRPIIRNPALEELTVRKLNVSGDLLQIT